MRTTLASMLACFVMAALAGGASAAPKSGISGTVTRSPTSPVCREDVPCSAPAEGFVLVALRNGVRVASATTSGTGVYRFVLRPGLYVVRFAKAPMFGGLSARKVRVREGRFTVVDYDIDTGIR